MLLRMHARLLATTLVGGGLFLTAALAQQDTPTAGANAPRPAPTRSSGAPKASVFKWRLPDGSIQYSDRPPEPGAQRIDLPAIQLYTAPRTREAGDATDDEPPPPSFAGYESIEITAPKPDEAVRNNSGAVSVQLALEPALRPGDKVRILMDGKPLGEGQATSITLGNVDRGSHSVQAVVVDAEGKELGRSNAVTFHLLRVARGG
ncbi:MAG: hypothetical protein H6983_03885 [Ectothiorhodospiraceae bacterium]|nr:hypothetical protein [Chromatiales bacterium]MCP5153282.1 hypothetical protein [Ectothiorhodospiraceae bacterium]